MMKKYDKMLGFHRFCKHQSEFLQDFPEKKKHCEQWSKSLVVDDTKGVILSNYPIY